MIKNTHIWIPNYIKQYLQRKNSYSRKHPVHIMFCLVDHFEPKWKNPSYETEINRVNKLTLQLPKFVGRFKDADGRLPRYTLFYPQEEYRPQHLDKLAGLCKSGFCEVEVHLHHDNDTAEGLREKIEDFKQKLSSHGLLSQNGEGKIRYGFIHGNWALDNSRRDGRMCGVNNELEILKETGCYADFTLPSAPSETQTKKINSIYYAKGNLERPKSHNTGIDSEVGKSPSGDLMIIQGPLALNWRRRKWGIFPRIENSEISDRNIPTEDRIDLWVKQHIHVKGKPNWLFIKVHTHGAQEKNSDVLLGKETERMFSYLESKYNDRKNYVLHYVTAREMFNIIKAAEAGLDGSPNEYRDYILKSRN